MKKHLALIFFFSSILGVKKSDAQIHNLIPNGGFETGPGEPYCNEPSYNIHDYIDNWRRAYYHDAFATTTSSPDWFDYDCTSPPMPELSPRYVGATSDGSFAEGLRVSLTEELEAGKTYTLRFKYATGSVDQYLSRFWLSNWGDLWYWTMWGNQRERILTLNTYPLGIVENESNLPLGNNYQGDRYVTEDNGHLHIWNGNYWVDQGFYATTNNINEPIAGVWFSVQQQFTVSNHDDDLKHFIIMTDRNRQYFDDMLLYKGGCNDDLYFENWIYNWKEAPFKARKIIAGYSVVDNNGDGNVVVKSTPEIADVTYRAGKQVDLMPGFHVERGANFHAYIAPCECDPNSAYAGDNYTLCGGGSYQLGTTAQSGHSYQWTSEPPDAIDYLSNTTISNPVFTPPPNSNGTVIYTLTVSNLCPEDYPVNDEVVINYNSSPNNNPSVSISNVVLGDYISFDVTVGPETEVVIIEITDENNNSLSPPRVYTYSNADFTCCNFPWQIPEYLSGCINYKVHVKVQNYCSEVYDEEIIDWPRTPPSGINIITESNIFTPDGDGMNDQWCIEVEGAFHYEVEISNSEGVIHNGSGNVPSNLACVWDGTCTDVNSCNDIGAMVFCGTYFYVLNFTNCNGDEIVTTGFITMLGCKTDETGFNSSDNNQNLTQQIMIERQPETTIPSIKIIPNPNSGEFIVQCNNTEAKNIIVQNMIGNTVYINSANVANSTEIDLRAFSYGVYVVKVQTQSGQMFIEKVVYK